MAEDSFVFFVEGIHGPPSEGDPLLQFARVARQIDMLPRRSRRMLSTRFDAVPGRSAEVGVPGGVPVTLQYFSTDIALWEVGHRIPAWFEEQNDVLTVRDPDAAEAHAHTSPQRPHARNAVG